MIKPLTIYSVWQMELDNAIGLNRKYMQQERDLNLNRFIDKQVPAQFTEMKKTEVFDSAPYICRECNIYK